MESNPLVILIQGKKIVGTTAGGTYGPNPTPDGVFIADDVTNLHRFIDGGHKDLPIKSGLYTLLGIRVDAYSVVGNSVKIAVGNSERIQENLVIAGSSELPDDDRIHFGYLKAYESRVDLPVETINFLITVASIENERREKTQYQQPGGHKDLI